MAVGRVSRRGGQAAGRAGEDLELAADLPRQPDPACEGVGSVPQQRAGEDRGDEGRLPGGDPARQPRVRKRGVWREHLRRARGQIVTPPHTAGILDGISRKSIIQIASDHGYEVIERDLARAELYLADEVFLSGTAAELVPVREIDDHPIGSGQPGPITSEIQRVFDDALHGRDARYAEWLDIVEVPTKAA